MLDSVKIGPFHYTISNVPGLVDKIYSDELNGEIDFNEIEIRIDGDLKDDARRITLWHEVVHGILQHTGHDHDEQLIDALAYGLVQVLDDNPGLR